MRDRDRSPEQRAAMTAVFALVMLAPWAISTAFAQADVIVVNANVITVDPDEPRVEALAVRHGRFAAVGTTAEVLELRGPDTRVIDAEGRTITPGFNDAHMHPRPLYPESSPYGTVDLSPAAIDTMDDLIAALARKAQITPPGQWVMGSRYQDTKLGRHPTRADLDQASTEHLIYIGHSSGHLAVVNSLALETAGITRDTRDPPGGAFDRDEQGSPTGVCRERAMGLVRVAGPERPTPTRTDAVDALLLAFENFVSRGITSIADAGISPDKVALYQDARRKGQPVRVYMMMNDDHLPTLKQVQVRTGFGDDLLRFGSIKVRHGNSLSGRTCWLYEPYADQPEYYGIPPARSQADLNELIFSIHEARFQAAVHSNGDREIDMVLNAIEYALNRLPNDNHRHRIEHASVVNPRILQRAKDLGVVLALHSYVYEHGDKMEAYGEARWGMMHANRTALEMGIPVAGNSDFGVSAADPLLRIQSLVTRSSAEGKVYGPEQRLTPEQAIEVFTLGSAYASFEEDIKGSISVGKLADFVVLSDDPTRVTPLTIKDIDVDMTFIGGELIYERVPYNPVVLGSTF